MHSSISFDIAGRDDPEVRALFADYVSEIDEVLAAEEVEASILAGPPADLVPPDGAMLLIRSDGQPVGIGGIRHLNTDTPEVKSMYLSPAARGTGLGPRLLAALEGIATERGCPAVRLDTSDHLTAAIALYRRAGYTEIPRYNDNPHADLWFERRL
jgi:ribosomal protein S18 acetylase RimI-like enzyme